MWRWQGEDAIVVGFDGPVADANVRARAAAAVAAARSDIVAAAPAARSVLVQLNAGADPDAIAFAMTDMRPGALAAGAPAAGAPTVAAGREHSIPVVYDGEDVDVLSSETGLTAAQIVGLHSSATYTVAFLGFMPGFAYLLGLPEALRVPRLTTPRTRIPAGAVAIAGGWAGIYPSSSPGGWRLLGRTDASLFDAAAESPALLSPGDRIRFAES